MAKARKIASDPLDIFANATSKLLKNLIDAIDNGTVPACSAQDNIKTLALMLAAYTSSEQGEPVPLRSTGPSSHLNIVPEMGSDSDARKRWTQYRG